MKRNVLFCLLSLTIALNFTACSSDDDNPTVEVIDISLDETTLLLAIGDEYTLTATVLPDNATDKTITWTSSNPAVASVVGGKINAVSAGTTTITAQVGDKIATCEVRVAKGVWINGVDWATCNVNIPGTFAASPESFGMFYQWGRKIGWSENDPLVNSNGGTTWDSNDDTGTSWTAANDPSPAGWRVPTIEEYQSLFDGTKVTLEWTIQNGVEGRKITDIATGANIFLPAAGWRDYMGGSLTYRGSYGYYWSSTVYNASDAYRMNFSNPAQGTNSTRKSYGFSVRCVAK